MQKTRQAIFNYLEDHRQATALELSRALGVTPANVRHHLKQLEERGMVQVVGQVHSGRRGRPTRIYTRTHRGSTEVLVRFIELLWTEFITSRTSRQQTSHFRRLGRRLAEGRSAREGTLPGRLALTIRHLHELGYEAHWEAHASAPRIVLERCPFDDLQARYPGICHLDAAVLQELMGENLEQVTVRRPGLPGPVGCTFQIVRRPPDPTEPASGS